MSRPKNGRMLFYSRDSGGKHEMTPGEYVRAAMKRAEELSLVFAGSPERIEAMIRSGQFESDDLYLDYDVKGNVLDRRALSALIARIESDQSVSHLFIPKRNRLARPENPLDGVQLELKLRALGVTLVFLERTCLPIKRGVREQIGELIGSLVEYDSAGKDLRELAEKILFAQLGLAAAGFSTGGRAPYGFCRWLCRIDGTLVRQLQDGERVRMAGHHVVWMPLPLDHPHMQIIFRILRELKNTPATRLAATLTAEGIPSPDSGRTRKDNRISHVVSGVWHAPTIVGIARNPLLLAVAEYGRRSMGDQLRFAPEGPRPMEPTDYRRDEKPKVIRNSPESAVRAEARFKPLVDAVEHRQLLEILDQRAGSQRNKPRSRDPDRNPFGGRIFDMNCTWPMYRVPKKDGFCYSCAHYMQTRGAKCAHNRVDGVLLTKLALEIVRQKLLMPTAKEKLVERLRGMAAQQGSPADDSKQAMISQLETELLQLNQQLSTVSRNLAFSETKEQFQSVSVVQADLLSKQQSLERKLESLRTEPIRVQSADDQVRAGLEVLDRLPDLVKDDSKFSAICDVIRTLNIRAFFKFKAVRPKKRIVNQVVCGVITLGNEEPPIEVYQGPTSRHALKENKTATVAVGAGGEKTLPGPM